MSVTISDMMGDVDKVLKIIVDNPNSDFGSLNFLLKELNTKIVSINNYFFLGTAASDYSKLVGIVGGLKSGGYISTDNWAAITSIRDNMYSAQHSFMSLKDSCTALDDAALQQY
jgi:hypothetical protein